MKDLTEYQESTLVVVQRHFKGDEITGRQIARTIRLRERESAKDGADMRSIVHALRVKGFPICANAKGYYYPVNDQELSEYIFAFTGRILQEQEALDGMKQGLANWSTIKPREVIDV